jgi:hypothetical protein
MPAIAGGSPTVAGYGPGELLGVISGELTARGLDVQDLSFDGVLSAIEVSNPADLGRGSVCVGNDGYFVWESWAPINGRLDVDRAVRAAINVLSPDLEGLATRGPK